MLSGVPPETKRDLLLTVGSHRDDRPLSPEEVARSFQAALDAGSTLADLAALVHFDGTSMVSRFLRLLRLPGDVLRVVGWGQSPRTISFTSASEISRVKQPTEQVAMAVAALESDLTTSEVKAIVQAKLRSDRGIVECIEAITRLRNSTIRRHVIMGAITEDNIKEALSIKSQNTRDALLVSALTHLLPDGHGVVGRLSSERFTLTAENEQVSSLIQKLPHGMEAAVTSAIRSALQEGEAP